MPRLAGVSSRCHNKSNTLRQQHNIYPTYSYKFHPIMMLLAVVWVVTSWWWVVNCCCAACIRFGALFSRHPYGRLGRRSLSLHRVDAGCSGSTKWKRNPAPPKTQHEIHSSPATSTTSRRLATKHVPRVGPYSPPSIDPGFAEIGLAHLSQSVKTTDVTHTHRQTDRQTDGQTN